MNKLIALLIGVGLIFPFATFAQAGSAEWDLDPVSGDWNTSANWTPMTVPNGPADTATFALSNTTSISISANTQVEGITFTPAATNSYTITAAPFLTPSALTVSSTGITNNSGTTHNFVTGVDGANAGGGIVFTNSATAGSLTLFTNNGGAVAEGFTVFFDTSTAGSGIFINNGGAVASAAGAATHFSDTATAGSGIFINNGGAVPGASSGVTIFAGTSTAANGTFTNNGGTADNTLGGGT